MTWTWAEIRTRFLVTVGQAVTGALVMGTITDVETWKAAALAGGFAGVQLAHRLLSRWYENLGHVDWS